MTSRVKAQAEILILPKDDAALNVLVGKVSRLKDGRLPHLELKEEKQPTDKY